MFRGLTASQKFCKTSRYMSLYLGGSPSYKLSSVLVFSVLAMCAGPTASGATITGVTVTSSIGECCGAPLANITSGSGLSSYDPSAGHTRIGQSWIGTAKTGFIDFNLNGLFSVTQIAVWNAPFGVSQYSLAASTDGVTYTPISGFPVSLTNPSTNDLETFAEIQTFSPVVASNIRMTLLDGYSSSNNTALREVMFAGDPATMVTVPEPGIPSMAGLGLAAIFMVRARYRNRSAH